MGAAKGIDVRAIGRADADRLVKRVHYSGTVTMNSQVSLGVFIGGDLHGVMQFGPPLDRRKMLPLVRGSEWGSVIELNRMAFDEMLPRNSESRALAVAFRMFRAKAPQVKWCLSFADGCQCGDGTIYRASGFVLTGIKENGQILRMPDGSLVAKKSLDNPNHTGARGRFGSSIAIEAGAVPLPGYQLRYIRFIDETWRDRLTVPVIPFDQIPDAVRMYRGERRAGPSGPFGYPPREGGVAPTPALHSP